MGYLAQAISVAVSSATDCRLAAIVPSDFSLAPDVIVGAQAAQARLHWSPPVAVQVCRLSGASMSRMRMRSPRISRVSPSTTDARPASSWLDAVEALCSEFHTLQLAGSVNKVGPRSHPDPRAARRPPERRYSQWRASSPGRWEGIEEIARSDGGRWDRRSCANPACAVSLSHLAWLDVLQPIDRVENPQLGPHAGSAPPPSSARMQASKSAVSPYRLIMTPAAPPRCPHQRP